MSMCQLMLMCVGILMSITGGLVHELGAGYFASDLQWVPHIDLLLAHPIGAIAIGVTLISVAANACGSRRGR